MTITSSLKQFATALCRTAMTLVLLTAATGCVDTDDIWDNIHDLDSRVEALEKKVADTNGDIKALQTIVAAMEQQVSVTSVDETANGYVIKFSNGKIATISNGRDGADGAPGKDGINAPEISVTQGSDGKYYWTLGGEMIIVDGKPLCATGQDGTPGADGRPGQDGTHGADAIAPQVRIDPDTKMWEISTDGGKTWQSTGVIAQGQNGSAGATGDSLFTLVNTDNPDYVTFVLANGVTFKVPRYDENLPLFAIAGCEGTQIFARGEQKTYTVEASNIKSFSVTKPDGWKAAYDAGAAQVTITAPALKNSYAETAGKVAFNLVSNSGKALIVDIPVEAGSYELRVLTFEDADVKFPPYTLDYGDFTKTITKWSDLIDQSQYGGQLLYNDYMSVAYAWHDKNNTELRHSFDNPFWMGGHAISNYIETDLASGDYTRQLSVFSPTGGHNGSANFAVHFGYVDDSGFSMISELPAISFADNKPRVIDHMYIMWNTYLASSVTNGNGLSQPLGPDGYVKIIATGYNAAGARTGTAELFIAGAQGNIQDWTRFDLTPLGKVAKVEFNVAGDTDNGYGFSHPAYFCYDDVAVRFE